MKKKILCITLAILTTSSLLLGGCGASKTTANDGSAATEDTSAEADPNEASDAGSESLEDDSMDVSVKPASEEDEVPDFSHYVTIDVENYGTIKAGLIESEAPETVKNFVDLAESGFYDGLTFHRIMSGFMIQGGDPLGNGTGGSDKTIKGEFYMNGVENRLPHVRGALSMARSNDPDSASSQFFIVHEDSNFLDGQYACFGYVTEGMEVVDKICEDAKPTDDNGTIPPEEQPVIKSITVEKAE